VTPKRARENRRRINRWLVGYVVAAVAGVVACQLLRGHPLVSGIAFTVVSWTASRWTLAVFVNAFDLRKD
jgi:hypothetical protein